MSSVLKVNTIKNATGTTGMDISGTGVVTRNVIPAWNLILPDSYSGSTANSAVHINDWGTGANHGSSSAQVGKINFIQGGCSVSTGIVTVPVAGLYFIDTHLRMENIDNGAYMYASISINNETDTSTLNKFGGAEILDTKPSADDYWDYPAARASAIVNLAANDNVRVMLVIETDTGWGVNYTMSHFKGYLIG